MKKITTSILCILFAVITVHSQVTLVKDLITTNGDSYPNAYLNGGTFVVFSAAGSNSNTIWASDGTENNTVDIGKNIIDFFSYQSSNAILNGNLFFVIESGNIGAELYKTDGTLAGTSIVKDINPNSGSNPDNFVVLNNQLFFTADDGQNGNQLWKSDGTEAGTILVSSKASFPNNITVFNNELYFEGTDSTFNSQLWKSDGTDGGTSILKEINGSEASSSNNFTVFKNELFFTAIQNATGSELWKTDGTEAGTLLVKDINPGVQGNQFQNLIVDDNNFYFLANDGTNGSELWQTDGTETGTTLVKNFSGNVNSSSFSGALSLNATTTLMVVETTDEGREIWKTNGTEAGTTLLKDIKPGTESGVFEFNGFNFNSVVVNNIAYFSADDGLNGNELWKTDGTTSGTVMVKNVNSNDVVENGNGIYGGIYVVNNTIIFEGFNTDFNRELWKTDGTESGTTILKDASLGIGWGAFLQNNIVVNNKLFYNGSNGNDGFELWITDGTENGTIQLKNIENRPNSSRPSQLTGAFGKLFFKADSTVFSNPRLFVADGISNEVNNVTDGNSVATAPNALTVYKDRLYYFSSEFGADNGIFYTNANGDDITFVAKPNPSLNESANITEFYHAKGLDKLFFAADDGTNGNELWISGGSSADTNLLIDLKAGTAGSFPADFFEFNNEVYFITKEIGGSFFNKTYTKTLYKTDGTASGTLLLKEFGTISFDFPTYFTAFKNEVYFSGYDTSLGANYLWATDGTVAGTKIKDVAANFPKNLIVVDNQLFYGASNFAEGQELWVSDGTNSSLFKSFDTGNSDGFFPFDKQDDAPVNEFYFRANSNNAISLWKSDGTLAGTVAVKNNLPFMQSFTKAGDVFYFTSEDDTNGNELWRTDGTNLGTELVQDLTPGMDEFSIANSSRPENLTLLGDDLYFTATTLDYGIELFKLENAVLNIEKETVSGVGVNFKVYPNPASASVTISSNFLIDIVEVFNLLGKRISFMKLNKNNVDVDVSQFSNGVYFVKVKTNNRTISKKLIIN